MRTAAARVVNAGIEAVADTPRAAVYHYYNNIHTSVATILLSYNIMYNGVVGISRYITIIQCRGFNDHRILTL